MKFDLPCFGLGWKTGSAQINFLAQIKPYPAWVGEQVKKELSYPLKKCNENFIYLPAPYSYVESRSGPSIGHRLLGTNVRTWFCAWELTRSIHVRTICCYLAPDRRKKKQTRSVTISRGQQTKEKSCTTSTTTKSLVVK